jgi:hypothetical protein
MLIEIQVRTDRRSCPRVSYAGATQTLTDSGVGPWSRPATNTAKPSWTWRPCGERWRWKRDADLHKLEVQFFDPPGTERNHHRLTNCARLG